MKVKSVSPFTVSAFYALLAVIWLILSDYVVFNFVIDKWVEYSEYLTDLLFIVLSTSVLFYVIRTNDKNVRNYSQKYRDLFEDN